MSYDSDMFFPAMARCDRCGQFMKRGLFNWSDHLEVCRGKLKRIKPEEQRRTLYVGPKMYKLLNEAADEYFK